MTNKPEEEKKEDPVFSQLRSDMYRDAVRMNGLSQLAVLLGCHAVIVCVASALLVSTHSWLTILIAGLSLIAVFVNLAINIDILAKEEERIHGYYMNDEELSPSKYKKLFMIIGGALMLAALAAETIMRLRG
jgi:uncharacterized membrane protein